MTTYSTDSFNRADSAVSLGSTDGSGDLDPLGWTAQLGTCGISSNQAYASVLLSGGGLVAAEATVDLTHADADVTLIFSTIATFNGLIFRFADTSNFWMWTSDAANSRLYKNVAGTLTQVGSSHSAAANGDVMRVVTSGSSISCYRNGTLLESQTDSFESAATLWGFFAQSTSARFDDWSALAGSASTPQALSLTQTQTPAMASNKAKVLNATHTQTVTVARRVGTILTVTQTQLPTRVSGLAHGVVLTATQVQV